MWSWLDLSWGDLIFRYAFAAAVLVGFLAVAAYRRLHR